MYKKMIAMAGALACAAVVADGIESANVVGYVNRATTQESASLGGMFVSVGASTWKLGDVKLTNATMDDVIQFLEWDNASTDVSAYYYNGHWYDYDTDDELDDQPLQAGTAFLCLFTSGNNISFEFAGEVASDKVSITTDQESPFLANPCPRTITLGEVTMTGATMDDVIQFLEWDNASTDFSAYYYNGHWYDYDTDDNLDDYELQPGDAFLGLFSGAEITVTFPKAIPQD